MYDAVIAAASSGLGSGLAAASRRFTVCELTIGKWITLLPIFVAVSAPPCRCFTKSRLQKAAVGLSVTGALGRLSVFRLW